GSFSLIFMIALLLRTASSACRSRRALVLENLALRHRLQVLQRSGRRPRFQPIDRGLWVLLSRLWTEWRSSLVLVKPEAVVSWHRKGFRLYWRWKSGKPGRPCVPKNVRDLIRRMSSENPRWGAPRIYGELLKLGIDIAEPTVSKYMVRPKSPPSQTWKTFLHNHVDEMVSVDFSSVPTATFRILYVFVVLSHERRRIVHFNVTDSPSSLWTARQLIQAFPWDTAPKCLLRDRDSIYGPEFHRAAHNLGFKQVKTSPHSPWQNPYVERLIGSIRRECLDHMIIFNEDHLRRVLREYFRYYTDSRTHIGLGKDCPEPRPVLPPEMGEVISIPQVGGLHHRYTRKAA
ncbi:MAG: integrase core domain-containing protein, partial [Candidatus Eisenbacteria bacterium]